MSSVNPYVVKHSQYNSFIYLVACRGLQAPASNQRIPSSQYYPVVLMVKENNGLWGVPGGQSEISDADAYSTARREFGEEIGSDVDLLTKNTTVDLVRNTQKTKHFCILFDGWAEHVEKVLKIPYRQVDNVRKGDMRISKEAAGYAWVSLQILESAPYHHNQVLNTSIKVSICITKHAKHHSVYSQSISGRAG